MIKKGLILIDGQQASTGDWVKKGQKIDLLQAANPTKKIFPLDLNILFEDEHLAVIHKPVGYPTSGNYFKTIENALPHNLKTSKEIDALPAPLPAHRLDTPTAGLLVCAKTRRALIKLQEAFSKRNIQKTYFALVHGEAKDSQLIDSVIDEKPARTLVKPLELFKIKEESYTLVEANPLTGKTHQIRIHLSRSGFPIVGDKIYGIEESGFFQNKNLFLFSAGIKFTHPITQHPLHLEIMLPKRFRNLRNYRVH